MLAMTGIATHRLSGAEHVAKMVHNGVEYGLTQAYAGGFELHPSHSVRRSAVQPLMATASSVTSRPGLSFLNRAPDRRGGACRSLNGIGLSWICGPCAVLLTEQGTEEEQQQVAGSENDERVSLVGSAHSGTASQRAMPP